MHKITYKSLLLSLFILLIGTSTGWLLTLKISGDIDALKFLIFGTFFSASILAGKVLIYFKAKKYLVYQLIFTGSFGLEVAWVFNSLFLPLLWVESLSVLIKIFWSFVYLLLYISNVLLVLKNFDEKWDSFGGKSIEKNFKSNGNCLNWLEVAKSMKFAAFIFIPGIPEKHSGLVSVTLFIFALVGLTLRSSQPIAAMMIWAVPFSVAAACCLQVSSYNFFIARRVSVFEKNRDAKLHSVQ